MEMEKRFAFTITGVSPLIMHRDSVDWADKVSDERTRIKKESKSRFSAGDDRCPAWAWKGYLHGDGERVGVPREMLSGALRQAGAKIALKGKETFKRLTQSCILIDPDVMPVNISGNGKARFVSVADVEAVSGPFDNHKAAALKMGFELEVQRVPVGQSKHVRVRPRFPAWSISGELIIGDDQITNDVVSELFRIAGSYCGLGDQRPSAPRTPGSFGRFTATLKEI